jgi:ribosomal protein S18 acetylase RimI-like enzyme
MPIACVDWRTVDARALTPRYAEEIERWSRALDWDTAASWDQIELGRRMGTVPGLIALDSEGIAVGWTFYLLHRGVLQVGGIVAASEAVTVALVDGVFSSSAARSAQSVTLFAFTDAPGLRDRLTAWGLSVGHYDYLRKILTPGPPQRLDTVRRWQTRDVEAAAALLGTAYPGSDEARPFAPHGTRSEWQEYVGQMVETTGCGTIMPGSSFVVPISADRIAGVVLTTKLAAATAHIAQIAVSPETQRRGLGRLLVGAASASAGEAGCERMTLLVDGRNAKARRLYETSGFVAVGRFISAGSCHPVRLTSVAAAGAAVVRL